jgi:hypothetical protein
MKHFALRYEIEIVEVNANGIREHGNGLRVSDSLNLNHMGFMEIAKVMGLFHDLAERVRSDHSTSTTCCEHCIERCNNNCICHTR